MKIARAAVIFATVLMFHDQAQAAVFRDIDAPGVAYKQQGRPRVGVHVNRVQLVPVVTVASAPGGGSFRGIPDWDAIAQCESGGRWDVNTGNGFWGGLQFWPNTWFAYGGGPFDGTGPFPYSREAQIAVAVRVLAAQGTDAWPNCFRWS